MDQLRLAMNAATLSAAANGGWPDIGSDNSVAVKVARLLQSVLQSTTGAAPNAPTSASIILNQLLNPTNGPAPMDVNLNQLLNNAVLQNVLKQLPPELLARPQIFEAIVLQNTLLPSTTNNTPPQNLPLLLLPSAAPANSAQPSVPTNFYRVTVEWQNRVIELISPQPLPAGNRLQLQTTPRGEVILLAAALAKSPQPVSAVPTPLPPLTPLAAQQQIAQQTLREILPRQLPLTTLVPVLQKILQPAAQQQLPAPILKAVAHLLQSLPKPEQMKTAEGVKQAVENSGGFLEARLLRSTGTAAPESQRPLAATDLKAQINTLLDLVRRLAPPPVPTAARATVVSDDELVYTPKPAAHATVAINPPPKEDSDSADSLIAQLSKLLQAGLARIQVNQLDSFSARHIGGEQTAPVPTWVLELPLRTPFGTDQLRLHVEQRQRKRGQQMRPQWNVQISLDLHELGKLAATLAIVDKNVSATLWAEREQTHRKVQEQIAYLRAGLESVGVNVTEMRCRLGMPPARSNPLSQRLVDVHT